VYNKAYNDIVSERQIVSNMCGYGSSNGLPNVAEYCRLYCLFLRATVTWSEFCQLRTATGETNAKRLGST